MEPPGARILQASPSVRTQHPSRTHGHPGFLSFLGAMLRLLGRSGAITPAGRQGQGASGGSHTRPGIVGAWELQADPHKEARGSQREQRDNLANVRARAPTPAPVLTPGGWDSQSQGLLSLRQEASVLVVSKWP